MKQILYSFFIIVFISIIGCSKSEETNSEEEPVEYCDTLVITVGGLGHSQMSTIDDSISQLQLSNSGIRIIQADDFNGYKTNIEAILVKKRYKKLILVGHSFGCKTVFNAAKTFDTYYLCLIDPVMGNGDNLYLPSGVKNYDIFYRTYFGIEARTFFKNIPKKTYIKGGHNDLPHDPTIVLRIMENIK